MITKPVTYEAWLRLPSLPWWKLGVYRTPEAADRAIRSTVRRYQSKHGKGESRSFLWASKALRRAA